MNKQLKKTVAREFLMLISLAVISLVGFIILTSYNSYCDFKIKNYRQEVSSLRVTSDSLTKNHDRKVRNQKWFYKKTLSRTSAYQHLTPTELWAKVNKVVSSGKFKVIYSRFNESQLEFYRDMGFNSYNEFASFVLDNTLTQDELLNKSNSEILKNEIKTLKSESIETGKNKIDVIEYTKLIVITLFILIFVMRYLIYGVRWSIKTLQES